MPGVLAVVGVGVLTQPPQEAIFPCEGCVRDAVQEGQEALVGFLKLIQDLIQGEPLLSLMGLGVEGVYASIKGGVTR